MPKKIELDAEQVAVVDGVRAVAVLVVIALHWKNVFLGSGGPLAALTTPGAGGVIIFFVVSGLCITLSKKAGESWRGFYLRRVFRLLPACWISLLLYLLVLKLGWDKTISGRDWLSSFLIIPNWLGQATVDGWERPAAELNPVLWSLQTEIELYLLFPLSLWLFHAFSKRAFLTITGAVTLIAWAAWLALRESFTYFPPFPALCHWFVWNLGLYLCFDEVKNEHSKAKWLALGLGGLAMGALLILMRNGYRSNLFSGWYVFTGVGTFLFLRWALATKPAWLRHASMVFIGTRSYSLYLNHWPAAILAALIFNSKPVAALAAVVLMMLVTELMYRWIEIPFIGIGKRVVKALETGKAKLAAAAVTAEVAIPASPEVAAPKA